MKWLIRLLTSVMMLGWAGSAWAVDSYRYLHVTIETPWLIFVFLFFLVFAPMILAVVLYWRHAMHRKGAERQDAAEDGDA